MHLELIADYQCRTGEGPLWHPTEHKLYWVDIPMGRLFAYDPATRSHRIVYEGDQIGGFTVQTDGSLLCFMSKGAIRVWRDGFTRTIRESLPGEEDSRFNDVIADPAGRVFCGTMATKDHPGRLYRLDTDATITPVVDNVGVSNGMGFTPDRKQMYYTDSREREIYLYDYDQASGAIANRSVFVHTPDSEGVPDGMTVDAEGHVWSARWDGGFLARYRPDGAEERRITFPAKQVSCPTFGGDDYADLYVTTAGGQDRSANGPAAGALYRVRTGIQGVPEFPSRVGLA